jgi:hypothetical protein
MKEQGRWRKDKGEAAVKKEVICKRERNNVRKDT